MLQIAIGAEGEALALAALLVELDQVTGDVLDALLGLILDALPGAGAERAQLRLGLLATGAVVRELVQAVEVDIDAVAAVVDELDELLRAALLLHRHQTVEAPHAVIGMHHEVAAVEALQLLEREGDLARARLVTAQAVLMVAIEELVLGEEHPAVRLVDEALMVSRLHTLRQVVRRKVWGEELHDALVGAVTRGCQPQLIARLLPSPQLGRQCRIVLAEVRRGCGGVDEVGSRTVTGQLVAGMAC